MNYSPRQAALVLDETHKVLQEEMPADRKLDKLWRLLVFAHSACLMRDLKIKLGDRVFSGPFEGMRLTPAVLDDNFVPHILGCYEQELHPAIERAIVDDYRHIVNIGCAFGYYSIGLALRMPQAAVRAFDIDEKEIAKCQEMAAFNKVSDRVTVGGEFRGEDFAFCAGQKTLAIVDVEGAELALLDPARYPALGAIDLIVELHNPSISKAIRERFAPTHDIELICQRAAPFPFERIFGPDSSYNLLDSFVASWEMREGPTPWGILKVKNQ